MVVAHDGDGGCSWWFLCISPLQFFIFIFFVCSLFLSQLFLVGLNQWLLGLKWWVVSVVAKFRLVMVGFGGGHLSVGWVSRWRSGLIGFLGFSWCFGGDLLWWVAVAVLGGAGFVFRWCCGGGLLWQRWVRLGLCFSGVVAVLWRRWVGLWWCLQQ